MNATEIWDRFVMIFFVFEKYFNNSLADIC